MLETEQVDSFVVHQPEFSEAKTIENKEYDCEFNQENSGYKTPFTSRKLFHILVRLLSF